MKILSIFTFLVLVVIFAFCRFGKSYECDQDSWRLVAAMYAYAISYPDDFPNFIENNRDQYTPGGQWQECAELLASQFSAAALSSASPSQIEEEAMSVASRAGAPELGPKVAESMMQTAPDMIRLASWLRSISNSVSEIQQGNLSAYYNSEVYQLSAFLWGSMQLGLTPEEIRSWQNIMYELNIWMVLQFAQQIS